MTAVPGEVAGLPTDGPATLAALKTRLDIADGDVTRDVELTEIVDAVNDLVRRLPCASRAVDQESWPHAITMGATQLGVRLERRKNSPDGVIAFAADAPVYVQRNDPDIAQLLELGPYAKPIVG